MTLVAVALNQVAGSGSSASPNDGPLFSAEQAPTDTAHDAADDGALGAAVMVPTMPGLTRAPVQGQGTEY